MKRVPWSALPRLFAAQGVAFALLLVLALLVPGRRPPLWVWPLLQGVLALVLSWCWGLGWGWLLLQFLLPWALVWQLGTRMPGWLYPTLLLILLLVFGGGLWTRVPLYHSNHAAWKALLELVPEGESVAMVDLGAGFGGPLAFLARHRPLCRFVGIEASPLVWLIAWIRTRPVGSRCRIQFGSLWRMELRGFHIVYAFLSPVPMPGLWEKAQHEMEPGSLLVSNTFAIPGIPAEQRIPLSGRKDACLWLYRIPERTVM